MPPCHHDLGKSFWGRIREHLSQLGMHKSTGLGRIHQGELKDLANASLKSPGDCRRSPIARERQISHPSS